MPSVELATLKKKSRTPIPTFVPSQIPTTTLTSRNARKYKPLEPKFTETRNSKSPKEKNVPSFEILTCAGRARFGDPRSHRSHCERTGKTPNPPLANAARDGIHRGKGAIPSSKGTGSTRFLNQGNLKMVPQLLQVMR